MPDVFGDLMEWGRVLRQIEQLRLAGQLDEHREGLIRLLRYRYNWQLRQAALRAVREVKRPSKGLIDALLGIVTDEQSDLETRLLACDAVRKLIRRRSERREAESSRAAVLGRAGELLAVPQPPLLREAVEEWMAVQNEPVEQAAAV